MILKKEKMFLPAICIVIYGRDMTKIWVATLPILDSIVFGFFVRASVATRDVQHANIKNNAAANSYKVRE